MIVRITMEASESLYEGEVVHPDQPSTLDLGEFDLDFIQLTDQFLTAITSLSATRRATGTRSRRSTWATAGIKAVPTPSTASSPT
jgi:hypothetical protein